MVARPPRLLVPVDFSVDSFEALTRAVQLARVHDAERLAAVYVRGPEGADPAPEQWQDVLSRTESAERAMNLAPALQIDQRVVVGSLVADAIVEAAQRFESDIIAVGTRGGTLLAGGIAEQLVRNATVDVLVVRRVADPRWPVQPVRVLVPVDFSDNARRALQTARRLADRAPVVAFHVVPPESDDGELPFEADPHMPGRVRSRLADWAGSWASECQVAQGVVNAAILDEAARQSTGLIVVGARGLRDEHGMVIGRISERVIQGAPVPVLVVR